MNIPELIRLAEARLFHLNELKTIAEGVGDISQLNVLYTDIYEVQETLIKLRSIV